MLQNKKMLPLQRASKWAAKRLAQNPMKRPVLMNARALTNALVPMNVQVLMSAQVPTKTKSLVDCRQSDLAAVYQSPRRNLPGRLAVFLALAIQRLYLDTRV